MIIAYCIFNVLWLFVWHHFAQKEIKLNIRMFLTDTLPYLFLATAVMTATHHITLFIDNLWVLLVSRIAIAALLYITIAWVAGSKELCEIAKFIFKRKVDL